MGKSKLMKALLALMLVLLVALAACSGDSDDGQSEGTDSGSDSGDSAEADDGGESDSESELYSIEDFNQIKTNEGEAIDGGTLTFGLVSDTAFEGTLNWNFYSGDPDAQILDWFDEALLTWDENYVYTNDGAATYEISEDGHVFTFTIGDNVNWHDGEPVTAEDWLFAHEVIGHPDYDGPRYGSDFTNIEGMEEYHAGEADTISGIKVIDDKTLEITYIQATPSLVTGSIWTYPLAKHIFGDMEVAEMSASPEVRENPIGFGPFKVESIVPGESVTMVKNEDYWRGEPNLDGVTVKVINPNVVVQELESGGVDTVSAFQVDQYPDNAEMSNVEYLGRIDRSYSYIGFKLGTWDKENGEVVTDPEAKMADVNLRKAMWHAVDNTTVGERFYNGLRWNATTLIPPSHPEFHDDSNAGVSYDPEAAKQLLDEAGYVDVDGDNFRENPDGEELVINFASMSGGEVAEPLAQYYIQAWEQVGLNVQLLDGRLQEFNSFYDRVGQNGDDDPAVDIYSAAWGVGIDVDPRGLYGRDAIFNFSRYSSDKNDELLAAGVSEDAFELENRQKVYNEWQQFMIDEVPVFPTLYRSELVPVNNRVHNYYIGDGTNMYRYDIAVTQEEPIVAE
ncbi:oligopeptide ABC transporter substrate-binding protein [Oceanobacillus profundus]|uniref:oligopeptide ABC transporter substrate-binding protein n=1 Tax=Oceanobacillus TaxID=182709 RepID=UPI000BA605FF|nr:oligopeptide ABC transporter substrate-binding protein [Oceanobacillus profundus]MBR3117870.1 oligopeptide ABC transporter substrate-binding protein [Oceanobacillus sp.]MCM3397394.1 oligopeptide ABC transporter substrate-binding protein [Oceanobacillus profundus]MDO6451480.1 oligopeptide ABC transporter substrate-binding protein [Oceanobacillus profundus]PAE28938.1 oligopeptide ABC transporter substrate-binding protein [Paenibacillus sp. 7884-2]